MPPKSFYHVASLSPVHLQQALPAAALVTGHLAAGLIVGPLGTLDPLGALGRDALAQAQWSLLLVWLVLGPGSKPLRIVAVPALASAAWYAYGQPLAGIFSQAHLALLQAMQLLPILVLARWWGVRLTYGSAGATGRARYSLASLIFLMTVSAVIVAVAQTGAGQGALRSATTELHLPLVEVASILALESLLVFTSAMRGGLSGLIAALTLGPPAGALVCYVCGSSGYLLFGCWTTSIAAILCGTALLLRLSGCRLVTGGTQKLASANFASTCLTQEAETWAPRSPCWTE